MKKRVLAIAATAMATMMMASPVMAQDFKIGICNYVDDASLNQIVDNIQSRLEEIGKEKDVNFDVSYDNCNADANVMEQIISDFQADNVDLMVGVATPVAMRMQSATEGTDTPVVFSAVSDPVGSGLVEDLDAPGANITGTSDYLDTASIMKLIQAVNPDVKKIGLLYDIGQDSSTTAIQEAKDYLDKEGIEYVERTGTTTDEVQLAADALVEKVDCINNLTDNTVVSSLPVILDKAAKKNIPVFGSEIEQVKIGCLAAVGLDYVSLGEQTGKMAAKVLKGEKKASELNFEVIETAAFYGNSKVAEDLGITFPEDLASNAKELFTEITQ